MTDTPSDKKFSVIIPAFNAEETIDLTLKALKAQKNVEDFEIIVVDDGSKDRTAEIVDRYPVKLIKQENSGPASARNRGVEAAAADIVLFTDSDCIPAEDWVEKMTAPFADEEISGVKGIYISKKKSIIARIIQLEFEERFLMLKKLKFIDFVDSYSAAFRKEAFLSVGGFDTSFPKADNEDVDLSYKLANAGYKMVFQPEAVVEHLGHPESISRYIKLKFSRGYWRTAVYKRHPGKAYKDSYTPQTLKFQIMLSAMVIISLPFALYYGNWIPSIIFVTTFFALTAKFVMQLFRFDPFAAIISPFLHFVRSVCFIFGVGAGIIRHFIRSN